MEFELRKFKLEDVQSIAHFANNKKIADNLRNAFPHPYTEKDAKAFISACLNADERKKCLRAISVDGTAIGSIGIFLKDDVYSKSAELGYWLAEPFWGKGIMSAAVPRICGHAFAAYDIVRIFAEPYASNTASRKVLEHAGFVLEGILRKSVFKNGQILDSCIYALIKDGAD
ncbi:MAG: GNAT family N-acetyltransferase [Bacillota bacterium]